jgi:hypothetical protein
VSKNKSPIVYPEEMLVCAVRGCEYWDRGMSLSSYETGYTRAAENDGNLVNNSLFMCRRNFYSIHLLDVVGVEEHEQAEA